MAQRERYWSDVHGMLDTLPSEPVWQAGAHAYKSFSRQRGVAEDYYCLESNQNDTRCGKMRERVFYDTCV